MRQLIECTCLALTERGDKRETDDEVLQLPLAQDSDCLRNASDTAALTKCT